jgi:hypothetical protein
MIYLYIGKHSIKLLGLSKTILGQFNPTFFTKNHSTDLIQNGNISGIDLVASAVKEALTNAQPSSVNDKEVTLILPQEAFTYGRFSIPADISETAIMPFIKDKVRAELQISIESEQADFVISRQEDENVVLFYSLKKEAFLEYQQICKLLQLKLIKIIPETLAYFKLFEKTLRKDKKEKIIYGVYREEHSFGYLFDSLGLISGERFAFDDDIKPAIKKKIDALNKEDAKVNRLILSGAESKKVRQDLFTKDVGAWTNPLEKIVDNFYQDYLKMIVANTDTVFPILDLDVCFGAFIFTQENKDFTLTKSNLTPVNMKRVSVPSMDISFLSTIFNLKTIGIFIVSFGLSFGLIFGFSNINVSNLKFQMPFQKSGEEKKAETSPTPEPTEEPEPSPAIKRADIKVKILNGSGVKGKASEIKETLQDAGYTDVITGNADNFDYETSEIQVKDDKKDAFTLLKEDLKDFATIKKAGTLDKEDTADAVFIIGADIQ